VEVADAAGNPLSGREVIVTDRGGAEAARKSTGADGSLSVELPEYYSQSGVRTSYSPYRVTAGAVSDTLSLAANRTLSLTVQ